MTNAIEQTKRELYEALARIRKARKHPKITDDFESALEVHLEKLNKILDQTQQDAITARQEHLAIQGRLQAIDYAYTRSQDEVGVFGEAIRERDELIRRQREVIGELFMQVRGVK